MLAGIFSQIRQQVSEETQIFYSIIKALFLVFFYFVVRSFLFLPIPSYFYIIDYKSKICLFFCVLLPLLMSGLLQINIKIEMVGCKIGNKEEFFFLEVFFLKILLSRNCVSFYVMRSNK